MITKSPKHTHASKPVMLKPTITHRSTPLLLRSLTAQAKMVPMNNFLKRIALQFGGFLFDMGVKLMVFGGGWDAIASNRATIPDIEPKLPQPHWYN